VPIPPIKYKGVGSGRRRRGKGRRRRADMRSSEKRRGEGAVFIGENGGLTVVTPNDRLTFHALPPRFIRMRIYEFFRRHSPPPAMRLILLAVFTGIAAAKSHRKGISHRVKAQTLSSNFVRTFSQWPSVGSSMG
jgi:hypothetical protein